MTNADVIRAMTNEELAIFLDKVESADIDFSLNFCDLCIEKGMECIDCKKTWLEMEYNKELF